MCEIGESAFSDCGGLTVVVVPGSVTKIGKAAFTDCNQLAEVYRLADNEIAVSSELVFEGIAEPARLYVHKGQMDVVQGKPWVKPFEIKEGCLVCSRIAMALC